MIECKQWCQNTIVARHGKGAADQFSLRKRAGRRSKRSILRQRAGASGPPTNAIEKLHKLGGLFHWYFEQGRVKLKGERGGVNRAREEEETVL